MEKLNRGIIFGPYFKSRSSVKAKKNLSDAIRYTWLGDRIPNVNNIIETIPKGLRYHIKDHRPKIIPYDGVHLILNHIIEIQFHTPETQRIRDNEIHHRLYRIKRYNDHIAMRYNEDMDDKLWEIYFREGKDDTEFIGPMNIPKYDRDMNWQKLIKMIEYTYSLDDY